MMNQEIDQIIIKGSVARKLLQMGFIIKDVRPQKQEDGTIDFSRNIFVFAGKSGLRDAVNKLLNR